MKKSNHLFKLSEIIIIFITTVLILSSCMNAGSLHEKNAVNLLDEDTRALLDENTRPLFVKDIPELQELSGIAVSKKNPGIFWTHNDGNSRGFIYALDKEGNIKDKIKISPMRDIEDIAIGTYNGKEYIFVGDVGDNDEIRSECQIAVIEEPLIQSGQVLRETVYKFVYSDDKLHDCESIAYNPHVSGGSIYLIAKEKKPDIFKLELSNLKSTEINVAQEIDEIKIEKFENPTAADISRDGLTLAVRNEKKILILNTENPDEFDSILEEEPIFVNCPPEPDGEAVAFDPDKEFIYTASEEQPKIIYEISY